MANVEELFLEGARLLTLKNFDQALEVFNQVLSLNPDYVKALEARAVIYLQKGEVDLAEEDLRCALKLEPENARIYYRLGQVYYRKKDLDQALELFNKAVELDPTYTASYMAISQVLRDKGLEEAADLELKKAITLYTELAKAKKIIDF
ncbi:MAG: tetratricopeptide repeat protein [Thermodesulfobacteriaceae bacterium]|nr:tetratricopeptide repeat protein [Thermodesulfobacteriaceae bacterium]MCX8041675.1 tetratricopeptide repeat protein [Thermodesulfobacteriaceae bacterium]MDW8135931.1 tetratricopeptide repeat protein [Thermodesulfobacterium sp.]